MLIDDMKEEDISGVCLIEEECFSRPWSYNAFVWELSEKSAVTLVCIDEMEIIGFINARFLSGEGSINNIAVTEAKRRSHVGDALMEELISRALKQKLDFLTLEVRKSNTVAIAFYEKHGFSAVGERKDFYEKPTESAILMTLKFI